MSSSIAVAASTIIYLGLDVHKDSVTVAVLPERAAAPTRIDKYPNDFAKLRRAFERVAKEGEVRACYERNGVLLRTLKQKATREVRESLPTGPRLSAATRG